MKVTIKSALFGVFVVLATGLCVLVTSYLYNSYRSYQVYSEVSDLTALDKALFTSLLSFRSERGDSRSAFLLSRSEAGGSIESMKEKRARVDAGMIDAKAVVDAISAVELSDPISRVMAAYDSVLAFRDVIDQQLTMPLENRDSDLRSNWMAVAGDFLKELEATSLVAEARMRILDPSLMGMIEMRKFSWSTRAMAGESLVILNNAVTAGRPIDAAKQLKLAIGDANAAYAWNAVGDLVAHPNTPAQIKASYEAAQNAYFSGEFAALRANLVEKISSGENPPLTIDEWRSATTTAINSIAAVAALAMDTLNDQAQAAKSAGQVNAISFLALFLAVIGVTAVGMAIIIRKVIRPLGVLGNCMHTLSDGNLEVEVPGADRSDEMGDMARSVVIFQKSAIRNRELEAEAEENRRRAELEREEVQRLAEAEAEERLNRATGSLAEGLRRLASGDLLCEISEEFAPQFEALRRDFNTSVQQLRKVLVAVGASGSAVSGGSTEISTASDDLAKRTEQQAASLEQTAAALEEITANVKSTSQRTVEARDIVRDTRSHAEHSGVVVGNAVTAMERIENASKQISQIITVIDEIAFQTNLLALNAGVEAARAGEAGKGFAVVAQEVRELAQRSAGAAKEIKTLIGNSEVAVSEGVKLVSDTGDGLTAISDLVHRINEHMDAIANAAQEQSVGLGEVNTAVNHMDQATQQNAAMVEEMNAAAAGLAQEAFDLAELLQKFKTDVGRSSPSTSTPRGIASAAPVAPQAQTPPRAVSRPAVSGNTALAVDEWEEF